MSNHQFMKDWLNSSADMDSIADNDSLIESLFGVLDDTSAAEELLEPICNKLFAYYRSKDANLRRFCVHFIPSLVGIHLIDGRNCGPNGQRKYDCVDVLLIGIYNLEVADADGQPMERTIRLPSLAKPSIYHEPSQHSSTQQQSSLLTELALSKLESSSGDVNITVFGPHEQVDQIIASNRMDVIAVLLRIFNDNISSAPKRLLLAVCRLCLRVLRKPPVNDFEKINLSKLTENNYLMDKTGIISRNAITYPLSSQILVELTNCIYYCLYNDVTETAFQALEEIHNRAVEQLYCDVLLMTNAIRNSLLINPGQLSGGNMGINVALSPTSNTITTNIAKTAITNASFKTRKLPDDIPIVVSNCNNSNESNKNVHLSAINEENEDLPEKVSKFSAIKGVTANIGKMNVMHALMDRKDKRKDGLIAPKGKHKSENGEAIIYYKQNAHDDSGNDNGSDTSGISDSKLSYSEETIPLKVFNQAKSYVDDDDDDDNASNATTNSSNSADAAKVPLVNTDLGHQSIVKQSDTYVHV